MNHSPWNSDQNVLVAYCAPVIRRAMKIEKASASAGIATAIVARGQETTNRHPHPLVRRAKRRRRRGKKKESENYVTEEYQQTTNIEINCSHDQRGTD